MKEMILVSFSETLKSRQEVRHFSPIESFSEQPHLYQ